MRARFPHPDSPRRSAKNVPIIPLRPMGEVRIYPALFVPEHRISNAQTAAKESRKEARTEAEGQQARTQDRRESEACRTCCRPCSI
jgi:hypothetical protein